MVVTRSQSNSQPPKEAMGELESNALLEMPFASADISAPAGSRGKAQAGSASGDSGKKCSYHIS